MRRLSALVFALGLAACDNPLGPDADLDDARARWRSEGYTSYRFTLRLRCFCVREALQPMTVVVRDGRVASVTGTDPATPVPPWPDWFPLTVDALFDTVEEAQRNAAAVEVNYHPDLGYPTRIFIDRFRDTVDEETTFLASDLTPLR